MGGVFIKGNSKNDQIIALLILVPMLIFTFFVTIKSEGFEPVDDAQQIVHEYFYFKNEKDLSSLTKLLINQDDVTELESQLNYIEKISLIYIKEEKNESILNAYLKYNNYLNKENLKIYKVNYEVSYNNKSSNYKYKNGIYESWFFLTRKNTNSKWLIDIYDE